MHRRMPVGVMLLLRLAVHAEGLLCGPVPHQGSLRARSQREWLLSALWRQSFDQAAHLACGAAVSHHLPSRQQELAQP